MDKEKYMPSKEEIARAERRKYDDREAAQRSEIRKGNFDQEQVLSESFDNEKEKRPQKLYRAFTINPEELSFEKFRETLTPININENDQTKVNDGNELGVYMSTNENMVKSYGQNDAFVENLHIKTPVYNNGYGNTSYIKLPSCGVIIEVNTNNLPIKKPEITAQLQGVYNNGMEGDEWIADAIPATNYRVKRLTLNVGEGDLTRIIKDIDGSDSKKLQEAIDYIKNEFEKKKQEALRYKKFLESLPNNERLRNKMYLDQKWKEYQENDDFEKVESVREKKNL